MSRYKEIIVRYDDKKSFIYGNTLGEVVGELVRCKECKHYVSDGGAMMICDITYDYANDDDYCSYGEREVE